MFIVKKQPISLSAEAYSKLRTSLEYSSVDKALKTIAVTSVNPGEGKTTVSGNLAYALATNDKKVLIIDCDLRKPAMHKQFLVSNETGLTDYLIGRATLKDVIKKVEKDVHVITSGTKAPNPAEMIRSNMLEVLLNTLGEEYDYIIIDTPPISSINDGRILSAKCDGTILVVKSGGTKGKELSNAIKELQSVNGNILGTILNGVEKKKNKYYYYYGE